MHQPVDTNGITLEEDAATYSFADLYKMVSANESVIFYINPNDLEKVKRGISNAKMREKKKTTEVGFSADDEKLIFTVLPVSPEESVSQSFALLKLQVSLVANTAVKVFKVIESDKEF